jgi:hypothetical protein
LTAIAVARQHFIDRVSNFFRELIDITGNITGVPLDVRSQLLLNSRNILRNYTSDI